MSQLKEVRDVWMGRKRKEKEERRNIRIREEKAKLAKETGDERRKSAGKKEEEYLVKKEKG